MGEALLEHDFDVHVVFETQRSFKIKEIERMPLCYPTRWIEPGKTALVPKRSIRFVEPEAPA